VDRTWQLLAKEGWTAPYGAWVGSRKVKNAAVVVGCNAAAYDLIYFKYRQQRCIPGAGMLAVPCTVDFLVLIWYKSLFVFLEYFIYVYRTIIIIVTIIAVDVTGDGGGHSAYESVCWL